MSTTTTTTPAPAQVRAPRLIATDLDGTFLSPDGSVSAENAAAVQAAHRAGIPVVFATGRPVRWMDVVKDLPGSHPIVIASNGAVLFDLGAGELLDRVCIDPWVALSAAQQLRTCVPGVSFAFDSGTRFGYEPTYRTLSAALSDEARRRAHLGAEPALFTGPAEDIAHTTEFVKMLVQSVDTAPDELLDRVRECIGSTLTATHSVTSGVGLVEISAPGVSKATMLQRCCDRLGIAAADVAVFGDMPNDVAMLTWAGMPHVVANAHPSLLDSGYTVVPGNAESGVGRTILDLIGPGRPR